MCESRGQRRVLGLAIVRRFGLGRRPVPDRLEDPPVVEPVDPFESCELDRFEAPPRATGSRGAVTFVPQPESFHSDLRVGYRLQQKPSFPLLIVPAQRRWSRNVTPCNSSCSLSLD